MKLTRAHWLLVIFNAAYIAAFTVYYLSIGNLEFLWYVAVLVGFFIAIALTLTRSKFDYVILGGLSLWGFLHMAGGGIRVGDSVLYAYHLIPIVGSGEYFILKYDQAVHMFGFGVATLVAYHLLKPQLTERWNRSVVYTFVALAGMGLGVVNEIVEFIPTLLVETGVGGYGNTLLDLIFNTLGAILAIIFIRFSGR